MAAKILNVDEAKLVRAAGGVVRRNGSRGAMRIAVVSDIHGNLTAFEAVLAAVDEE